MTVTRSQNPGALACGTTVFPTNMASSWGGNTHPVFFNHNAICERFLTKFAKLTIDSPAAMAKLAIDRASIVGEERLIRAP